MTREEAKEFQDVNGDFEAEYKYYVDEIFDYFEQRIEKLEAKLKKYEEPVAEFEGKYRNANSVFSDIDISCERLGAVCGYDHDLKPCKVIIIEADK